jgi:hypothetical protein
MKKSIKSLRERVAWNWARAASITQSNSWHTHKRAQTLSAFLLFLLELKYFLFPYSEGFPELIYMNGSTRRLTRKWYSPSKKYFPFRLYSFRETEIVETNWDKKKYIVRLKWYLT